MKRVVPFIFPILALLVVLALLVRWYSLRTSSNGEITPQAESIEVKDISPSDQTRLNTGAQNLKSVDFTSTATNSAEVAQGKVRYEVTAETVNFSISVNLPELETGVYQVWLKSAGRVTKAMVLELEKGGWMASGSVNKTHLPLEITVTHEATDDAQMEKVLLNAQITEGQ